LVQYTVDQPGNTHQFLSAS